MALLIGFIIFVILIAFIIWADIRDERALDEWYDHPDQIWNQWKNEE